MSIVELFLLVLVAGVCGALGRSLAGSVRGGVLVSIALGFIGALIGVWLAGLLGLPDILSVNVGRRPFPIAWSILGAALFVCLLGLLRRRQWIA
ncbi:MAG: GlsB/YeaQ/YmgE family stress response membrane protein [Candidatus Polarisedimenticolia bacterium]